MSNHFSTYGGSVRVEVAADEIERVMNALTAAEVCIVRLQHELPALALTSDLPRLPILAAELPWLLARVRYLKFCCWVSRQSYFNTEGRVRNLMQAELGDATSAAAGALSAGARRLSANEVRAYLVGAGGHTTAPSSVRSMLERLDATEAMANGTMRVESWAANGQRHFLVYLPGTQDWSPIAGENPLNLPSDLQAVGNGTSDSQTAVMAALRKAGARPGDEIMFVAHSQGGLVAANVAQHPAGFKVSQILAFAAPLAGIAAMKSTSVLALEHTNDPVPYLAGKANPLARNFVTVQSTAKIPGIAAHILNTYGTLASAVDHTKRPTVAAAKKRLMKRIPSGTRVKVQLIKVERKPKA